MILKTKFQDEDFELGEVVNAKISDLTCYEDDKRLKITVSAKKGGEHTFFYSSIAEFLEMWEDAQEEPKEYWCVDSVGGTIQDQIDHGWIDGRREQIGNYFGSEEEARRAVEKLKAWKRLKDLGTEILGWEIRDVPTGGNWQTVNVKLNIKARKEPMELLDILFGGEE